MNKPTYDDFRRALAQPQQRRKFGIHLSSRRIRRLLADEIAARSFYERWRPSRLLRSSYRAGLRAPSSHRLVIPIVTLVFVIGCAVAYAEALHYLRR